jgi:hypothetical protein
MVAEFGNVAGLISKILVNKRRFENYACIRESSKGTKKSSNEKISKSQAQKVALKWYLNRIDSEISQYRDAVITNEEIDMFFEHPQYAHRIIMKDYVNRNDVKKTVTNAKRKVKNAMEKNTYNVGKSAYNNIIAKLITANMEASMGRYP